MTSDQSVIPATDGNGPKGIILGLLIVSPIERKVRGMLCARSILKEMSVAVNLSLCSIHWLARATRRIGLYICSLTLRL